MSQPIPTSYLFTIGGEPRHALSGKTASAINPATGEIIAEVPVGSEADVNNAVDAAQSARKSWGALDWATRGRTLRALAARLEEESETFALLDTLDGGNPLAAMRTDVASGLEALNYFAGLAGEAKGASFPASPNMVNFTVRQPYGAVGRIVAFNHPFMFAIAKIAAALAAGNTIVLKPSDHTSLSALHLGAVASEILPPGVLNVVAGGADVGNAMVTHPDLPRIAFTGSVDVARRIMTSAAANLKVLTFELGGKNPMIVAPDVDVKKAAIASIAGMNFARSQGQSCQSFSRVFVHSSIYDEFIEHATRRLNELRVGDPLLPETDMGPLAFAAHRDQVLNYVRIGEAEGARVVVGGSSAPVPKEGFYVAPTMFANVTQDMTIAREEIFGPVMSIMRWDDEEAMLADANSVDYGLTASIWTNDASRAYRLASAVDAGYVWINKVGPRPYGAPFGGFKFSGLGKESNLEELISFTREKVIDHSF
jgi:betaine-aldehyde dehydrogenase